MSEPVEKNTKPNTKVDADASQNQIHDHESVQAVEADLMHGILGRAPAAGADLPPQAAADQNRVLGKGVTGIHPENSSAKRNRNGVGLLIQPKLILGPANDPHEREADRVANDVVGTLRAQPHSQRSEPGLQCSDDEDKKRPELLQAQALTHAVRRSGVAEGQPVAANVESRIERLRGGGKPMEENLRNSMEGAFDADFREVKIHTDAESNSLNHVLSARAFTTGRDIYFRKGEYNPSSTDGKRLIAHELTHVVQQSGGEIKRSNAQHPQEPWTSLFAKRRTEQKHLGSSQDRSIQRDGDPVEVKDVTVARNISNFVQQEHPEWKSVLDGIYSGASDAAKMDQLLANFKKNAMGFQYTGAARQYSLTGDCGSLSRTFKDIAENVFLIENVATKFHNGGKGWYVGPGFHEIDANRGPNVDNGGYYFKSSHVWVDWGGTIYDVLFGEKGQNGREADEGKSVDGVWHFKIDNQWFRTADEPNTYVSTNAPE